MRARNSPRSRAETRRTPLRSVSRHSPWVVFEHQPLSSRVGTGVPGAALRARLRQREGSLRRHQAGTPAAAPGKGELSESPPTDPGVVSLCFQLSDFFLPLQELLPAHVEFFRQRRELLGNEEREAGPSGQTLGQPSARTEAAPALGGQRDAGHTPGKEGLTTSPGPHRPPELRPPVRFSKEQNSSGIIKLMCQRFSIF